MFVLTANNELPVITRKTSWPLKLVITDFYCTFYSKNILTIIITIAENLIIPSQILKMQELMTTIQNAPKCR